MLVESWPLSTDMWDGECLAGPLPTLFATDPVLAMDNFNKDLAKAHWDLAKLYKVLYL